MIAPRGMGSALGGLVDGTLSLVRRIRRPLPAAITLVPGIDPDFSLSRRGARLGNEFRRMGFRDVGAFRILEVPGGRVDLFLSRAGDRAGVVYANPQMGSWAEALARLDDGRILLVSAAPAGHRRPEAPTLNRTWRLGADPARLVRELEREVPPGRLLLALRRRSLPRLVERVYSGEASPQWLGF